MPVPLGAWVALGPSGVFIPWCECICGVKTSRLVLRSTPRGETKSPKPRLNAAKNSAGGSALSLRPDTQRQAGKSVYQGGSPSLPCSPRPPMGQQVPTPHTLCCHTMFTRPLLNGESPAQPANLKQSSPEPPHSQAPASPQQLRHLLRGSLRPSSIRELELLQPLRGSTSFAPFWIRFKAVLHTSWPRRWLPRGSWLGPYRLGGRPERRDEPRSAGPGRGRQTDP